MADPSELILPDDVKRALADTPLGEKVFCALPPTHKREYLRWIYQAKRATTRERRIGQAALAPAPERHGNMMQRLTEKPLTETRRTKMGA